MALVVFCGWLLCLGSMGCFSEGQCELATRGGRLRMGSGERVLQLGGGSVRGGGTNGLGGELAAFRAILAALRLAR